MEQRQRPGGDAPGGRRTEHGEGRDQQQVADAVGHRVHDGTERPRPAGAQRDRAVEPVEHAGEDDQHRGEQRPPPALGGDDRRAAGGGDPGDGERVGGDPRDRSRSEPLHPAQPEPRRAPTADAAVQGGPALLAGPWASPGPRAVGRPAVPHRSSVARRARAVPARRPWVGGCPVMTPA